jgi:lipopolysaccharide export system permease protein
MEMPDPEPSKYLSATFASYRILIPLLAAAATVRQPDIQELNSMKLLDRLHNPSTVESHRLEYLTEMAVRSAGALSPFVFFWLGCPLGLSLEKHARATGFAMSLGVLFLYYGLMAVGIGLGRRHLGLSSTAPWLPVVAGLVTGMWLWGRRLRQ